MRAFRLSLRQQREMPLPEEMLYLAWVGCSGGVSDSSSTHINMRCWRVASTLRMHHEPPRSMRLTA
jgi:hypothetical protein